MGGFMLKSTSLNHELYYTE